MKSDRFIRDNAAWLGAGVVLTFSASIGQTFFIALFADPLRTEFSLSHGDWGAIYTVATVCSAIALVQIGKLADILRVRTLAMMMFVSLFILAMAMANVSSVAMLVAIIFGLRLCGQGMMTHIAITAMARWFARRRGRAVAVAYFGVPIGQAILPIIFVTLIAAVGWRETWVISAAVVAVVLAPLVFLLLRRERKPQDVVQSEDTSGLHGRHWTRSEVVRHWFFWALAPGLLAAPFISTAIFFHQAHIVEIKGWSLTAFVLAFPFYSGGALLLSFLSGLAIDRLGTLRLLPLYLLPLSCAVILVGVSQSIWVAYLFFFLMGMSNGTGTTLLGTLWAEFYGTKNIGAVRALAVALMVFSSALGPGVTGVLIDWGIGFETQCYWMAGYILIMCSMVFPFVARKITIERDAGKTAEATT